MSTLPTLLKIQDYIHLQRKRRKPSHLLLTGISGSGKTFLAKQLETFLLPLTCKYFRATEFFKENTSETERAIKKLLVDDKLDVVIIDDLDCIAHSTNESLSQEVERRLLIILRYCLDMTNTLIIGVTAFYDALDKSLLFSGRFCESVNLSISHPEQRASALREIIPEEIISSSDELASVAHATAGFSFADLQKLYALTVQNLIRSGSDTLLTGDQLISIGQVFHPSITSDLPMIKPSSLDMIHLFQGFDKICHEIAQFIKLAIGDNPQRPLSDQIIRPPKGILVYGPSGCGKTTIALAAIKGLGFNILHVQATMIRSKYLGESEKNLYRIFKRAKECAPCILFIDGLESIFSKRSIKSSGSDRLITSLLTELDGLESSSSGNGVIILATTTNPSDIDSAILRPGRIEKHFKVPQLDEFDRKLFIQEKLKQTPVKMDITWEDLMKRVEGLSIAELDYAFREAALSMLRHDLESTELAMSLVFEE